MQIVDNEKHSILVIDDDIDNHRFLTKLLEHEGHAVTVASSGREGLQLLEKTKPDLVVLDINMPGVDGYQTLKLLRKKEEFCGVILLSADTQPEDIVRGLDSGAVDYICKPFNPHELAARIRCHLRVAHVHGELRKANDKLKGLVDTDDLTGLYNMRNIYNKIDDEIERARRYGHGISVIMMDMDNFKFVNDGHNHLFGSFVLSEVGKVILQNIRKNDFAARFGGDEFMICLTRTTNQGAIRFANRLKHAISNHVFEQNTDKKQLTASFGVAVIDQGQALIDARTLTRVADSKLYVAKDKGRNRIEKEIIVSEKDISPEFFRKAI